MTDAGRSSVRVNGRPATAAYVREIGDAIAEIVGQHEAQRLLSPAYHLELLDRFAGEAALRSRDAVASAHAYERESRRGRSSVSRRTSGARANDTTTRVSRRARSTRLGSSPARSSA